MHPKLNEESSYFDINHSCLGDWFSIDKLDSTHIRIKMEENKTGEDINMKIYLDALDAADTIEIIQKAE